jgi:macrophage erythroblast attacher
VKQEENIHAKRVKMRIENLREIEAVTSTKAPEYVNWSKTRLDRVIVDYLLREGMPNTATKVAKDSQIEVKK